VAVQVSYPGVYIDEFAPGAPIEGVGTSTAAFIGPTATGEIKEPTKITSWDRFRELFGYYPVHGHFLWYAVRGFFQNAGQVCYVVRASNGKYAEVPLANRANADVVRVRAREPGANLTSPIHVEVIGVNLLQSANTSLFQPASTYNITGSREIELPNASAASQFKPGDWVDLGAAGSRLRVSRVVDKRIRLESDLTGTAAGNIRLADAPAGTDTVRIVSTVAVPDGVLGPGTMLTMTQGTGTGAPTDSQIAVSVQSEPIDPLDPTKVTYRVTFREGLNIPLSLDQANPAQVQSEEFHIRIGQGAATVPYDNLSIDPAHDRYYVRIINNASRLVRLELVEPPPSDAPPRNLLQNTGGQVQLTGGGDEVLASIGDTEYSEALETLREIDDVNLISIPDGTSAAVQQAVIAHCEQMADRFGVLDARPNLPLFGSGTTDGVDTQRRTVDSTRGYAALYYPWLRVAPAVPGDPILVPPSGHVCGIMARTDNSRGVFKAPANEYVNGAVAVERTMSNIDQGQLNLLGINVIRVFESGGRPQLWGARTTATDRNWQYVNIRRLFLFLEESIQQGINWAVFEPNNRGLWEKLKLTIRAFLLQQWRDGAFFGATPDDAFYVRIDEVLNPFSEQALGRLHIEIGVRPSYPAEFIIVRIGIWQGRSEVTEG
jgi:phage tail sheath protein FI